MLSTLHPAFHETPTEAPLTRYELGRCLDALERRAGIEGQQHVAAVTEAERHVAQAEALLDRAYAGLREARDRQSYFSGCITTEREELRRQLEKCVPEAISDFIAECDATLEDQAGIENLIRRKVVCRFDAADVVFSNWSSVDAYVRAVIDARREARALIWSSSEGVDLERHLADLRERIERARPSGTVALPSWVDLDESAAIRQRRLERT